MTTLVRNKQFASRALFAGVLTLALAVSLGLFTGAVHAQDHAEAAPAEEDSGVPSALRAIGIALAAALVMALAALATAKVQSAVGAGGTGALAEKPELFIPIVVLIAIPETIVVLGFVIALLLWSSI